jgi:hypothetical protein
LLHAKVAAWEWHSQPSSEQNPNHQEAMQRSAAAAGFEFRPAHMNTNCCAAHATSSSTRQLAVTDHQLLLQQQKLGSSQANDFAITSRGSSKDMWEIK